MTDDPRDEVIEKYISGEVHDPSAGWLLTALRDADPAGRAAGRIVGGDLGDFGEPYGVARAAGEDLVLAADRAAADSLHAPPPGWPHPWAPPMPEAAASLFDATARATTHAAGGVRWAP